MTWEAKIVVGLALLAIWWVFDRWYNGGKFRK